ncbi:MAG TPA: polyprenyl synthetase family protein [Candidatus Baltobacteraceae bacterium]
MIEPRSASERDLYALVEDFFRHRFQTDNPLITEAVRRMLAAGGKRLRPRITLLAAEAMGGNAADHLALAAYMELIHVATLIHDDVVDGAQTRRGVNATAVDFGNRISVLAGDYLFAWIFKNVTAGYDAPIPHILSATLAAICDGEVLQLRAMGNLDLPFDDYVEIVEKKTATLFGASAECGAICGGQGAGVRALREFGIHYGIAFQMMDDLLDVTSDEAALGKPVGNDLRERKVTIPLICALKKGDAEFRARVEEFFDAEVDEQAESAAIADLIARMGRIGAFEATHDAIHTYVERAKLALGGLGTDQNDARDQLASLADRLSRNS